MTGEMSVINHEGDTKLMWDRDNRDEVDNARRTFDDLVGTKKYAAFSVTKKGDKDEKIKRFDPDAERIILVPPIAGGSC